MIEVTQTQDSGYTVYKFTANNTDYTVMIDETIGIQVWSNRKSLGYNPQVKVYDSLAEMSKRSKALKNLAALIAA